MTSGDLMRIVGCLAMLLAAVSVVIVGLIIGFTIAAVTS
jgi:hypothetical protein